MTSSVYITNNPLHVLHSIALIKKGVFNRNHIILWCGSSALKNFFPKKCSIFDYQILDLHYLSLDYYFGFQESYKKFLTLVSDHIDDIDFLITCFDTHLGFEALRHEYNVHWENVAILEDGIGNYFRSTMPLLRRQIPKSLLNFFTNGYLLNMTRSNLGGNPKVGYIGVLEPNEVFKHPKSKANIIEVKEEFKWALEELRVHIPQIYKEADVLISLTHIFSQNRMTSSELKGYIDKILDHPSVINASNIVLKPHPRENLVALEEFVKKNFGNKIGIADQGAVEMYLPALQNMTWTGLPSSGFLYSYLLYGDTNEFLVFPYDHMPFSLDVLQALKRIMGPSLKIQYD